MQSANPVLLIACGALAHELVALQRQNQWQHVRVRCLPADLHQSPQKIPQAVEALIERHRPEFPNPEQIVVAYGDCGTGGLLDAVLKKHQVQRLEGAHCYAFFAGQSVFDEFVQAELGTFYLTDFLLRHFERLVWQALGLDKHPELLPVYFGNYRRLMYLTQMPKATNSAAAETIAQRLGLDFEQHQTGLAPLARQMQQLLPMRFPLHPIA